MVEKLKPHPGIQAPPMYVALFEYNPNQFIMYTNALLSSIKGSLNDI